MNLDVKKLKSNKIYLIVTMVIVSLIYLGLLVVSIVFWNDYNTLFYFDIIMFCLSFLFFFILLFIGLVLYKDNKIKLDLVNSNITTVSNVVFIDTTYEFISTDKVGCYKYNVVIDGVANNILSLDEIDNINLNGRYQLKISGRYVVGVLEDEKH